MSTLILTLALTFGAVLTAIILLGISWLILGKSKLRPGACGRNPHECQKDANNTVDCTLCNKNKAIEKPVCQDGSDGDKV